MRRPIIREVSAPGVAQLPDDMLEAIIAHIPPIQLISAGWRGVCSSMQNVVEKRLRDERSFSFLDQDVLAFFSCLCCDKEEANEKEQKKAERLLALVIRDLLRNVEHLTVTAGVFLHLLSLSLSLPEREGAVPDGDEEVLLPSLKQLDILLGRCPLLGVSLSNSPSFEHVKTAKRLCHPLTQIHLDLWLSDEAGLSCCKIRPLIRVLKDVASEELCWDVSLHDLTAEGQGWVCPSEQHALRDRLFVAYVRVVLEARVLLGRLRLVDEKHPSPYMMVMNSAKRRALYMHHQFKMCQQLQIEYDVGSVSPSFLSNNDLHTHLSRIDVNASHVLYKSELLEYLKTAINLRRLCIHRPASWCRRVSSCTRGCFSGRDFACFRLDGWLNAVAALPNAHLELD